MIYITFYRLLDFVTALQTGLSTQSTHPPCLLRIEKGSALKSARIQ
jgi:hypothetical protein